MPGIGTFRFERSPATGDFANKQIHPPSYAIALQANGGFNPKRFFGYLSVVLNISERDAVVRFNDFAFDMKRKVSRGDTITWDGVGTISRGLGGDVKFEPAVPPFSGTSVNAEKILRDKAEHTVRVGEDEKTSVEMREWLNQPEKTRSYWWAIALVITLLATIFIGWYLSEHGLNVSSISNSGKTVPLEAEPSYKVVP